MKNFFTKSHLELGITNTNKRLV